MTESEDRGGFIMGRFRRFATTTAIAVVTVLWGTFVAVPSAQAEITQPGYYSVPYSETLYRYWVFSPTDRAVTSVTLAEWRAAGYPRPTPTGRETEVVKYPWSPTLYAVTFFEGAWLWERLDAAEWARAGHPVPRTAGWIEGSYLYKWETGAELFIYAEDGTTHKLTYEEWVATGLRQPEVQVGQGYMKLTWSPEVFRMFDLRTPGAFGYRVSFSEWAAEDYPTPEEVTQIPGAYFCQFGASPAIYYSALGRDITYAEWQAAGFPAPRAC